MIEEGMDIDTTKLQKKESYLMEFNKDA